MLKLRILILLLAPFVLISMTIIQRDEFKKEVDAYVDLLLSSYDNTNETYSGKGNAIFLHSNVRAKWKKEISLKHKSNAANDLTKYPQIHYGFYQFSNKKKCKLAVDSLFNCFGNDCVEIKWGENKDYISSMSSIYIINDYEIIVCKAQPIYELEFWYSITSELTRKFKKPNSRIIRIDPKGVISFEN